jgi:hypothetical protein
MGASTGQSDRIRRANEYRDRSDRLYEYAAARRSEGHIVGPEGAVDAEDAAFDYYQAAIDLEYRR